MANVMKKTRQAHSFSKSKPIAIICYVLKDSVKNLGDDMHDTYRVQVSCMGRSREDVFGKTKLLDVSQALKEGMLKNLNFFLLNFD
tara:strand:+ start:26051 stop:26308 length:258 start_codon:yes stop_codon:yes gene_type:complete